MGCESLIQRLARIESRLQDLQNEAQAVKIAISSGKEEEYQRQRASVNTILKGAYWELAITCDLLQRGYYVFRNVSHVGPCDLIAIDVDSLDGAPIKIEVTTAIGSGGYAPTKSKDRYNYDVMALVTESGTVTYFPDGLLKSYLKKPY